RTGGGGRLLPGSVPSSRRDRRRRARSLRSCLGFCAFGRRPAADSGGFLITEDFFGTVPADPTIHVLPPGISFEMSTITDFDGVVGASEIRGTAHGSDGSAYSFDTDMRFMQGTYIDTEGRLRKGSFGFV